MRTYREMADNDDIVGAILYAIEFLARQTTWKFEPAFDVARAARRRAMP